MLREESAARQPALPLALGCKSRMSILLNYLGRAHGCCEWYCYPKMVTLDQAYAIEHKKLNVKMKFQREVAFRRTPSI